MNSMSGMRTPKRCSVRQSARLLQGRVGVAAYVCLRRNAEPSSSQRQLIRERPVVATDFVGGVIRLSAALNKT